MNRTYISGHDRDQKDPKWQKSQLDYLTLLRCLSFPEIFYLNYLKVRDMFYFFQINHKPGAPGWLSRLNIRLLVSAQIMISWFRDFEPHAGLALCRQHRASLGFSLSSSLHPSPTHAVTVSQNKFLKNVKCVCNQNNKNFRLELRWQRSRGTGISLMPQTQLS